MNFSTETYKFTKMLASCVLILNEFSNSSNGQPFMNFLSMKWGIIKHIIRQLWQCNKVNKSLHVM